MPNTRLVIAALASAMCFSSTAFAATFDAGIQAQISGKISSALNNPLAAMSAAPSLAQSTLPTRLPVSNLVAPKADTTVADDDDDDSADSADTVVDASAVADQVAARFSDARTGAGLRDMLIGLAMQLRHTRYVRGGRDPSTGFDCSGFVSYVFAHALGLQLPSNSASQFLVGHIVRKNDMKPGDLVFFRTAGRHGKGRVSHVGIYLSDGRFIHSPRRGESVRVDNLSDAYWSQRFAGARRPDGMAKIDSFTHNG